MCNNVGGRSGVSTEDGKVIQIPISKRVASKKNLLGLLEKHGLEKAKPVYYYTDPDDKNDFLSILRHIWPDLKVKNMPPPEKKEDFYASIKVTVTRLYHRALAKIGVHYFLAVLFQLKSVIKEEKAIKTEKSHKTKSKKIKQKEMQKESNHHVS